ncbi:MAG: hypothetical protein WAN60_11875 [Candidatus Sulfotelmatobacter sp.]
MDALAQADRGEFAGDEGAQLTLEKWRGVRPRRRPGGDHAGA